MSKVAFKDVSPQPRPTKVPLFLQKKHDSRPRDPALRSRSRLGESKQFQQLFVSEVGAIARIRDRVQFWVSNTPRVLILSESIEGVHVKVQSPKKSLLDHLKFLTKVHRLEKVLQAVVALSKLSEIYGYFYCDKQMMRVAEDGAPVVWMHEKFSLTECEFPILYTTVSEMIFVKKIKTTFNQILDIPRNVEIESRKQLISYIQLEHKKITAMFQKFPQFLVCKMSSRQTPVKNAQAEHLNSAKNIPSLKNMLPNSLKFINPARNVRLTANNSNKELMGDEKSEKSKTISEANTKIRTRGKTTYFTKNLVYDGESDKKTDKSESNFNRKNEKSLSNHSEMISKNKARDKVSQFCAKPKLFYNHERKNPSRHDQFDDTINEEFFHFQPQYITPKSRVVAEKKCRKQSADVHIVSAWTKQDSRMPEKAFQNSTFSTRVTFSSLKGQFEDDSQSKEKRTTTREKKKILKAENIYIPHLYCNQQEKVTKQKFSADIRKIMKQSGMKIAEEDFENEVDNLFESHCNGKESLNVSKMKQSELLKQFDKLFDSGVIAQGVEHSYAQDFQSVIN